MKKILENNRGILVRVEKAYYWASQLNQPIYEKLGKPKSRCNLGPQSKGKQ